MADYLSMTAFVIPTHTQEQQGWLGGLFEQLSQLCLEELIERGEVQFPKEFSELLGEIDLDSAVVPEFERGPYGVRVWADEVVDAQLLGLVIRAYLKRFHPDSCFAFQFACTCSKFRSNGFGGGYVFATAYMHTVRLTEDVMDEHVEGTSVSLLRSQEPCSPGCPGLGVFDGNFEEPEGWVHIERCDACGKFPTDDDAAASISPEPGLWCVDCGAWSHACVEDGHKRLFHPWRTVVPEKDARAAGLLPEEEKAQGGV